MNQVAKTEQAVSVPGSRPVAGMRNIAAVERMAVEEVTSRTGITFNDAAYMYRDFGREIPRQRENSLPYNPGRFNTPSQTFVILFQLNDVSGNAGGGPGDQIKGFAGLVAKAISTYEANARVLSGTENARGSSLSMIL